EAIASIDGELVTFADAIEPLTRLEADAPLVVLGYGHLSRCELDALRAIATRGEVLVLTPTPCAEFFEDATRRAAETDTHGTESRLLSSWGTAAREHVAALDAATDYASERDFADSDEATLLGRTQASIRERRAIRSAPRDAADRSLMIVAAPSLRREVERI